MPCRTPPKLRGSGRQGEARLPVWLQTRGVIELKLGKVQMQRLVDDPFGEPQGGDLIPTFRDRNEYAIPPARFAVADVVARLSLEQMNSGHARGDDRGQARCPGNRLSGLGEQTTVGVFDVGELEPTSLDMGGDIGRRRDHSRPKPARVQGSGRAGDPQSRELPRFIQARGHASYRR